MAPKFIDPDVIESLRDLKEGWNSYKAKPITEEALKTLETLRKTVFVVPSNDGGLQIEVLLGGLIEAEIEIDPTGKIASLHLG